MVIGGQPLESVFQFSSGRYQLQYQAQPKSGPTEIFLSSLTYGNGFQLQVSPADLKVSQLTDSWSQGGVDLSGTVVQIPATSGPVTVVATPRTTAVQP
jgi:hypothetical protein